VPDEGEPGWGVLVKHAGREDVFEGDEAVRVAGLILPGGNRMAGSKQIVSEAVERLEAAGDAERLLTQAPDEFLREDEKRISQGETFFRKTPGFIHKMPRAPRLALEMALHEEQERRALAGELLALEAAWRQAEEIAGIADNLLVPREIDEFIARHRPPDRQA